MKIGIISDIHSNIQALETVLKEFNRIKVDKIIISGYIEEKIIKNVIVGIYNKKLSKNYNALIGLNLLEKENEQEDEPITNF